MKIITFQDQRSSYVTDFTYNENGLLTSRHSYILPDTTQHDRTRIFKYNDKQQLIYEGFNDDRPNNTKGHYFYNKEGQLISSTQECNYTHSEFTYGYDFKGRLIRKQKNSAIVEVTSYEYSQNHLISEILKSPNRTVETTYKYDSNGLCILQKENGKVIQKNNYSKDRLVERLTFAHGCDPGYYPCSMQYVLKYEYY